MKETLEAWQEIKDYIDFCSGKTNTCNAIKYNSTEGYLQPLIKKVDDTLNAMEELMRINYFSDLMGITYILDSDPECENPFLEIGRQRISVSRKNEKELTRLLNNKVEWKKI